jgi:hypothetical protein
MKDVDTKAAKSAKNAKKRKLFGCPLFGWTHRCPQRRSG